MFRSKSSVLAIVAALTAVMLIGGTVWHITAASAAAVAPSAPYILIDPGHGGPDGGASTADGANEDDINLQVAGKLRDMLVFYGYTVKMTRTTDTAIADEDEPPSRSFKTRDMYNRLEMYNAAQLTVSIHQNHFSQSQYYGTQLFYSKNTPQSRDIAECIRSEVVSLLQPQNTRQLKAAGDTIFLLDRTEQPAVIVECGFLSNPEEARRMQDEAYQQQLAFAICCGILKYHP